MGFLKELSSSRGLAHPSYDYTLTWTSVQLAEKSLATLATFTLVPSCQHSQWFNAALLLVVLYTCIPHTVHHQGAALTVNVFNEHNVVRAVLFALFFMASHYHTPLLRTYA